MAWAGNTQPLWELRRVSKHFPGVKALDDVSVTIRPGEIHGLVGENGSGKSTLIKCLSGVHQPDEGILLHRGRSVVLPNPHAAQLMGVATIYQEFSLVPSLTVAENLYLGRLPQTRGRLVDWGAMREGAHRILETLGLEIDPNSVVGNLSVAEQQLVEIAKSVSTDATLLIMDEPTTALGLPETKRLHKLIRTLASHGRAVLYVSHRLDDVLEVSHRITVLKDGRVVATRPNSGMTHRDVIRLMVGSEIEEYYPKEHHASDTPLLTVRGLRTAAGVTDATFTVHRGEVLGLAGMLGSGRTAIARAIFGLEPLVDGVIEFKGRRLRLRSPREAIAAGLGSGTVPRCLPGAAR
ncbi:MAG: sugar ABC transporter ATP-binding protein [Firmicutes bacterium]|nr:sugar ABC transporter ATP-binding protein [Bacillota bacterium]